MKETEEAVTIQDENHESLLALLQETQAKYGCVPEEFIAEVAKSFNISMGEVYGVATFYSFLSSKPLGRNIIRVCQSLPCYLKNSQMIIESVANEIGIRPGENTRDGKFSFELTNCIGACDESPAMLINNDVHTNLTPEKITSVLKEYE